MKRLRIIAIAVAVLLLGWLVVHFTRPKEPSYQGRTLSEWIRDYMDPGWNDIRLSDADRAATRQSAGPAVKEIGTNAIPLLLHWLQARDPAVKIKLNSLLEKQSYIRLRFGTAWDRQSMGVCGFEILGYDAMPAVPALTKLMESQDQGQRLLALICIMHIDHGKKVLFPTILQSFQSSDRSIQRAAAVTWPMSYPEEAERAGVYKMFPMWKRPTTNNVPPSRPGGNK